MRGRHGKALRAVLDGAIALFTLALLGAIFLAAFLGKVL